MSFTRTPRLVSAIFSSSFTQVVVAFDQDTSSSPVGCDLLLDPASNGLVGSGAVCSWSNPSTLVVQLGSNALLLPRDALTLVATLRSADTSSPARRGDLTSSYAAGEQGTIPQPPASPSIPRKRSRHRAGGGVDGQSAVVQPPASPVIPKLVLMGPALISSCDTAGITAVTTSARASFRWGCSNDQALSALLAGATNGSVLSLRGELLGLGKAYMITAQAVTAFGTASEVRTLSLERTAAGVPLLAIQMPPPPYVRTRPLYMTVAAHFSQCAQSADAMSFAWTLSQQPGPGAGGSRVVLQSQSPMLDVPAGLLSAGATYTVGLLGFVPGQAAAQAQLSFSLTAQAPVAQLGGGNRLVFHRTTLDASGSYDPNACSFDHIGLDQVPRCLQPSGLAFVWACSVAGQPCRLANMNLVAFPRTPAITVDVASLGLPPGASFQMSVTVSSGGGSSSTAVTLTVASEPTLELGVKLAYATISSVAFQAVLPAAAASSFAYVWQLVRSGTALPLPTSAQSDTFLSGFNQPNLVIKMDTPWAADNLLPGVAYRVRLDVTSAAGTGSSWASYTVPLPPSGGTCAVSPTSGLAMVHTMLCSCQVCWGGGSSILPASLRAFHARLGGRFGLRLPPGRFDCLTLSGAHCQARVGRPSRSFGCLRVCTCWSRLQPSL